MKTVSGEDKPSTLRLEECHKKWSDIYPSYSSISDKSKGFYDNVFAKFTSWCAVKDIEFIEHVHRGTALAYSKHLWDSGITGKTYNEHLKHLSRT